MSIEDFALKFEGLSDQQIADLHAALVDTQHTVGTVKALIATIEAELPRIKRTVATFEGILATVNAKQKAWS